VEDKFKILKNIGEGSFGRVCLAELRKASAFLRSEN
jgi:serine/threonine protein kinase